MQEKFFQACEKGDARIVQLLLADDSVNPAADNNYAIRRASNSGHIEVVKILLTDKRVDPSDEDNDAIRTACEHCHAELVKLLLADPRVNPSDRDNWAIREAVTNNDIDVIKVLLDDPRVVLTEKDYRVLLPSYCTEAVVLLLNDRRINIKEKGSFSVGIWDFVCFDGTIVRVRDKNANSLTVIGAIDDLIDKYIQWLYRIGGEKHTLAKNSVEN